MNGTYIHYTAPSVYSGKLEYGGVDTYSVLKHRIPHRRQENLRTAVLKKQQVGQCYISSEKKY